MNKKVILSNREREVALLLLKDKKNEEIAAELGISSKTVHEHRKRILKKTKCKGLVSLYIHCEKTKILEYVTST